MYLFARFSSFLHLLSSQPLLLLAAIIPQLRDCLPACAVVEDYQQAPTPSLFYPMEFPIEKSTEHTSPPIICARDYLATLSSDKLAYLLLSNAIALSIRPKVWREAPPSTLSSYTGSPPNWPSLLERPLVFFS